MNAPRTGVEQTAREIGFDEFCHWQASAGSEREALRREFCDPSDWIDARLPRFLAEAEIEIARATVTSSIGMAA